MKTDKFVTIFFLYQIKGVSTVTDGVGFDLNEIPENVSFAIFNVRNEDIKRKKRTVYDFIGVTVNGKERDETSGVRMDFILQIPRRPRSKGFRKRRTRHGALFTNANERGSEGMTTVVSDQWRPLRREMREETFRTKSLHDSHRSKDSFGCYTCKDCGKPFVSQRVMDKHANGMHGGARQIPSKTACNNAFVYVCLRCGDEFTGSRNYERHGRAAHRGEYIYRCGVCRVGFLRKSSLNRHAKEWHSVEKMCCSFCPRRYARADKLREHERICRRNPGRLVPPGSEPFYCDICEELFHLRWDGIRMHKKRHELREKCPLCPSLFNTRDNPNGLTQHMLLRHPSEIP